MYAKEEGADKRELVWVGFLEKIEKKIEKFLRWKITINLCEKMILHKIKCIIKAYSYNR